MQFRMMSFSVVMNNKANVRVVKSSIPDTANIARKPGKNPARQATTRYGGNFRSHKLPTLAGSVSECAAITTTAAIFVNFNFDNQKTLLL
jgi:hypothetical protein